MVELGLRSVLGCKTFSAKTRKVSHNWNELVTLDFRGGEGTEKITNHSYKLALDYKSSNSEKACSCTAMERSFFM